MGQTDEVRSRLNWPRVSNQRSNWRVLTERSSTEIICCVQKCFRYVMFICLVIYSPSVWKLLSLKPVHHNICVRNKKNSWKNGKNGKTGGERNGRIKKTTKGENPVDKSFVLFNDELACWWERREGSKRRDCKSLRTFSFLSSTVVNRWNECTLGSFKTVQINRIKKQQAERKKLFEKNKKKAKNTRNQITSNKMSTNSAPHNDWWRRVKKINSRTATID